jgi:ABC-2 type transport system permease protein
MINSFRQIIRIFKREIDLIFQNPSILLLLFAAPIVYSFLYTAIFMQKLERDVPLAVVDYDKSKKSRELIRYLDAHEAVKVNAIVPSENEAYSNLQNFKTMAILIIPKGFESKIKRGLQTKVSISVNNTRFMIANDIVRGVNDVISDISKNTVVEFFKNKGIKESEADKLAEPLILNSKSLFNNTESYGDFIIVGLLALILQQLLLISVAMSSAHEKETGMFKELIHKISGSYVKFIIGKAGIYFLFYSAYAFLFFTLHYYLYKLPFQGSVFSLILLTLIQFITLSISGLFIGSYFPSKIVTIIILVFSSYPIFLLSGYSWPIQAFPGLLKIVAYLLPQTSYFQAYTIITQQGGSFSDINLQLIRIFTILLVVYTALVIRLRFLRNFHSSCSLD